MQQELLDRRAQAEAAFNNLQTTIQNVKAKLREYGVETLEEAHEELMRLQGEFRVVNDLLNKPDTNPPVSPTPETVDVEAATAEPKGKK